MICSKFGNSTSNISQSKTCITLKYTLFVLVSIIVNLFSQLVMLAIYSGPLSLFLAMCVGAGTGLIIKYNLDKRWVFYHQTNNKNHNAQAFILYVLFGGLITSLFFISEIALDLIVNNPYAKFLGALIGLVIGYIAKYQLDKRYIFTRNSL
jgi:putative flippase GtrA